MDGKKRIQYVITIPTSSLPSCDYNSEEFTDLGLTQNEVKELITNGFLDRVTEDEIQHIEVKITDQEYKDIVPCIADFCEELRSIVGAYIAKLVIDEDNITDVCGIISSEEIADYLEKNYDLDYIPDFYSIEISKSKNDEEDV